MSERGERLLEGANRQIGALLELLSTGGQDALALPCPGREELGDGSVGATAQHVAAVYQQLAGLIHEGAEQRARPDPGHGHEAMVHGDRHDAGGIDLDDLLQRLSGAMSALGPLAAMTDERLDSVPAAGSFRFCDGRRTLERVIAGVLNHQGHHIEALKVALA
jgi:hypothetical protein